MAEYKRQHTVSESYLRGFTLECHGHKLCQYDKKTGQTCFVDPGDASIWNYGYSYRDDIGQWNHDAEKKLGNIESDAVPVITKIEKGHQLTSQDRYKLAVFVMSSIRRPRAMVEAFIDAGLTESRDPRWIPEVLRRTEKDLKRKFNSDEIQRFSQKLQQLGEVRPEDEAKERQMAVWFRLLPQHARGLLSMEWMILSAKSPQFFITSDAPAFTRTFRDPESRQKRFVTLRESNVEVTMPLTQSRILLVRHKPWSEPSLASRSRVSELNARVIRMANRFVWSPAQCSSILAAFNRFKDVVPPVPPIKSLWAEARQS